MPTRPTPPCAKPRRKSAWIPAWVEVIGQLPTYTTGIAVHHHAGGRRWSVRSIALTLNAFEVADAFEVPLDFLMNPAHHRRHAIDWPGVRREWFSMPYMDGATERFVWGATAGMLRNFYRFLSRRLTAGIAGCAHGWPLSFRDELFRHPVRPADRAGASVGAEQPDPWRRCARWARWVSRNFDTGKPHHGWVAWTLAVVVPSLAAVAVHWALVLLRWGGRSPCCGAWPCCT